MEADIQQNSTEFITISHLNLSPAQLKVVSALARGGTVTRAARLTGVHRTTIHHWIRNEPNFKAAIQFAQNQYALTLADQVREVADLAISAFYDLLKPDAPSALRLKAALAVLDRGGSKPWTLPDFRVDTPPEQVLFAPEPQSKQAPARIEAPKEA